MKILNRLTGNDLKKIIAGNLKKYRKQKGLTQEQVAYLAGITRALYAKYETEKSGMTVLNLVKLAKVFDVKVDELVN